MNWNCLPGGTEKTPEKSVQFKLGTSWIPSTATSAALLGNKFWTRDSEWLQVVLGLSISRKWNGRH